jgi:tight adherence protein C
MLIIVPALIALGIFGFFVYLSVPRGKATSIESRLASFADRTSLEEIELEQPFSERVVKPMVSGVVRMLGRMTPATAMERTRKNLALAGNPNNMQVADFMGMRTIAGIGLALLLLALGIFALKADLLRLLALVAIGGLLGYMAPVYWLGSKIKSRQKAILRQLPDAIDLMTVSVEAGLGFDSALQRVADKWTNELSVEIQRTLSEMRVGKSRREALREMSNRAGVNELTTFVASIIQADQLGVSMAKVLRIQADQMRIKRRQRAEEQGHKAPVLMMFPMVFLIFPAMYIVILGPSVPQFACRFAGYCVGVVGP